jgi:hypothetical protein
MTRVEPPAPARAPLQEGRGGFAGTPARARSARSNKLAQLEGAAA